ncbi:helix-turn-helix transcriptional regulator [Leucobacter sp. W1153]|uniref:helix-turn-helix transcriptional regulator n=1 Tax=Leucobacter sp. W1153 TaxID=3439064 RepID=UPI003F2DB85F
MITSTQQTTQGQRLYRSRSFMGIKQEEMAKLLGKSKNTVSNWENDHVDPPLSAMAQWAKLTGRTIDWIAFGDETEEAPAASAGASGSVRPKGFEPLAF